MEKRKKNSEIELGSMRSLWTPPLVAVNGGAVAVAVAAAAAAAAYISTVCVCGVCKSVWKRQKKVGEEYVNIKDTAPTK